MKFLMLMTCLKNRKELPRLRQNPFLPSPTGKIVILSAGFSPGGHPPGLLPPRQPPSPRSRLNIHNRNRSLFPDPEKRICVNPLAQFSPGQQPVTPLLRPLLRNPLPNPCQIRNLPPLKSLVRKIFMHLSIRFSRGYQLMPQLP
jgi:hypothetical protein